MANKTIVIIDDEADILNICADEIKANLTGFEVICASGVKMACEIIDTIGADIVICDYYMCDGNWRDVISKTKSAGTFIMHSSYTFEKDLLKSLLAGGVDYVFSKPANYRELARIIIESVEDKTSAAA